MRLSIRLEFLVLALVAAGGCLPGAVRAETPTAAEATTGTNIFSVPETDAQTAVFTKGPPGGGRGGAGGGEKLRQLLGNTRDGIPDFKQIQMLPTLTQQQRGQLRQLNKGNKVKVQQLVEQLKKLREQRDTAGGAVTADMRGQFAELRSQLQALRKQSWEQSKALLSDSQIRDIQAMKRGELQPSTFRGGATSSTEMMSGQ